VVEPQVGAGAEGGGGLREAVRRSLHHRVGLVLQGVRVIADILERAGTTDPDKFVEAARKTDIKEHVVSGGPIQFNEQGDNIGASSSMVQIREGRPRVIYPKEVAEIQPVYPIPKLWERG